MCYCSPHAQNWNKISCVNSKISELNSKTPRVSFGGSVYISCFCIVFFLLLCILFYNSLFLRKTGIQTRLLSQLLRLCNAETAKDYSTMSCLLRNKAKFNSWSCVLFTKLVCDSLSPHLHTFSINWHILGRELVRWEGNVHILLGKCFAQT